MYKMSVFLHPNSIGLKTNKKVYIVPLPKILAFLKPLNHHGLNSFIISALWAFHRRSSHVISQILSSCCKTAIKKIRLKTKRD